MGTRWPSCNGFCPLAKSRTWGNLSDWQQFVNKVLKKIQDGKSVVFTGKCWS